MNVFVAGHRGLVGSALVRRLTEEGHQIFTISHGELDLTDTCAVIRYFASNRVDQVYLAAAVVGGIQANIDRPGDFIRDNLLIQTNVIDAACCFGVQKLLFLGSCCVYPRHCPQPIQEESYLSGPPEPTNAAYAIAKIAGIHMCQAYRQQYGFNAISIMPCNVYGPGDKFDGHNGHVLASLMLRFHEAVAAGAGEVVVWGTGTPRREFIHADDLADACVWLMDQYSGTEIVNVGCGADVSIAELAELIADVVGFRGRIRFDAEKPDGVPRKLLDVSRLRALGWSRTRDLVAGVRETYRWFLGRPEAS